MHSLIIPHHHRQEKRKPRIMPQFQPRSNGRITSTDTETAEDLPGPSLAQHAGPWSWLTPYFLSINFTQIFPIWLGSKANGLLSRWSIYSGNMLAFGRPKEFVCLEFNSFHPHPPLSHTLPTNTLIPYLAPAVSDPIHPEPPAGFPSRAGNSRCSGL